MTAVADGEIEEGIDERIARGAFEWLVRMYADDSRDRLRTLASTAPSQPASSQPGTSPPSPSSTNCSPSTSPMTPSWSTSSGETAEHRPGLARRLADPSARSVHPSWARALSEPELITENPSMVGVVSAVAETDPDVAVDLLHQWDQTDPAFASQLVDILRVLPPEQAVSYLDNIDDPPVVPWGSPTKPNPEHDLRLHIESLVDRGIYDAALRLLAILLEPPKDTPPAPLCDSDVETHLDADLRSGYGSVLNVHDMETFREALGELARESGAETATVFEQVIHSLLDCAPSEPRPASWSISCSDSIADLSLRDCETYLQRLLVILCDVSDEWFGTASGDERAEVEQFVDSPLSGDPPLRSLGWCLLRYHFKPDSDRVVDELTSPSRYPQTICMTTFQSLLHEAVPLLDDTDRLAVEYAILRVPADHDLRPNDDEFDAAATVGPETYLNLWLDSHLAPVRPHLSKTTHQILANLTKRLMTSEMPKIARRGVGRQIRADDRSNQSDEEGSGVHINIREEFTEQLRSLQAEEVPKVVQELTDDESSSVSYPLKRALIDVVSESAEEYGRCTGRLRRFRRRSSRNCCQQ